VCPSFLTGDQDSLIQARLVNRLANPAERIEPLLATLALAEEMSDRLFDQFVAAPIGAVSEFPLDLPGQIRRQRYVHDLFSLHSTRSRRHPAASARELESAHGASWKTQCSNR